jgi:hypothetical protein
MKMIGKYLSLAIISFNSICQAQQDSPFGQSDILLGGGIFGQIQDRRFDNLHERKIILNIDVKLGYFLTNKNLLYFKMGLNVEDLSTVGYSYNETNYILENIISYRRYLPKNFFAEIYLGSEHYRNKIYIFSETIDKDKILKIGFSIGQTFFINENVGIEFSIYNDYDQITYKRESIETYNFWRVGTKMGLVYLFNIKNNKHE